MTDRKRTITKLSLYLRSMKIFIIIGGALSIGFALLLVVGGILVGNNDDTFGLLAVLYIIRNFVGITLFLGMILYTPLFLKGIYWINGQENFLGFCFNEEMKKLNVNMAQLPYRSDNWFIAIYYWQTIAIHRDYIISMENYRVHTEEGGQKIAGITIVCADGRKRKIRGVSSDVICSLKWWVEQGNKRNEQT